MPALAKEPTPGPEIAGVFEGAGSWRLDFIDGGVLVNCSMLSPDQHNYTIDFKNNRAILTLDTTPKPLVLTLGADGKTITGQGPVTIDGVVAVIDGGPEPEAVDAGLVAALSITASIAWRAIPSAGAAPFAMNRNGKA